MPSSYSSNSSSSYSSSDMTTEKREALFPEAKSARGVAVPLRRQLHSDTDSVLGGEGAGEKKERFVSFFSFSFS